jgi:ABC-type branched-subunit amino acid transport system substrate-binding protein/outer membrane protein assembly factor BamD (BamD/ComL family)
MNTPVRRFAIVGLAVLVAVTACARTKPGIAPLPRSSAVADSLFQQADRKYQSGALSEALGLFNDYLARFPDEPLAPSALMRIGTIQTQLGNGVQARVAYQRLASSYPDSPLRAEALIENLNSLLREGRFDEVVAQSREALQAATIPAQRARVFALSADAQAGSGHRLEAVDAYTRALKLAAPSDQEMLIPKLRAAILSLGTEEVRTLSRAPEDDLPMDYLLFQAGMLLAREGRPQDARLLLEAFRERYPGHDQAERAESALSELPPTASAAVARTVGCLLPLSGGYQSIGQKALRGIELAAGMHHAAGGPPVNVIVKDTESDAGRTLQALQELERENAFAVVGPVVHAEAVNREAQRLELPMIAVTQKDGVVGVGDYVFRNFITPAAQVRSLAAYAVGTLGVTQAVILYPDEPYGRTFMGLFRDELAANGGTVLLSAPYSPEATDFSAVIKRLLRYGREVPKEGRTERREPPSASRRSRHLEEKDTELVFDFQAIFIPDEPKKAGMLVPQLAYHDVKNVHLLGTNLWHSEDLIRYAEPYVQGAVMPDAFFDNSPERSVQRFVSAFEETYQERPGFIEAIAFDSAGMLFEVLARPDVRTRRDVAAALHSSPGFSGAAGRTRFDATGDCDKVLHILTVKGKKFVELE